MAEAALGVPRVRRGGAGAEHGGSLPALRAQACRAAPSRSGAQPAGMRPTLGSTRSRRSRDPQEQQAAPKPRPKVGVAALQGCAQLGEAIAMVTEYDCPSARLADGAGVDAVLVGDSVGMVVLGQKDTTSVTMDEMVHGRPRRVGAASMSAMVIGDLPFGSCLTAADAARISACSRRAGWTR